ncbi:alpha/beta fold hydrolase [Candidatus Foliamicus sp.]
MLAIGFASPHARAGLAEFGCLLEAPGLSRFYARCANLAVPLDPEAPQGETIDLFVARIPARMAQPQPDPLLLITGGPGQSAVDFYLQLGTAFAAARRERDIILVDQRGTGRSALGFECDFPLGMDFQIAETDLLERLVSDCLVNLDRDPRFFTTSVAVRDLEAVRRELGVEQWNIYGVSYGSRVAQHYLRRYPQHVRSVVLDGVVPAPLALGPEIASNAQEALDAIFARCARDAACAARFGDLPRTFSNVMSRLETSPVSVARINADSGEPEQVLVNAEYLMGVTRLFSYSSLSASLLPLIIDEAAQGRFDMLLAQAERIADSLERSLSLPMHNSVICSEDYPFAAPDSSKATAEAYLGSSIMDAFGVICAQWPRGVVDADFKQPLVSDHPVLLLSGANDPATPARYADETIAGGLGAALHLVARDQGHVMAAIGCVPGLMREFFAAGSAEGLDGACLERVTTMPFFISAAGPGP